MNSFDVASTAGSADTRPEPRDPSAARARPDEVAALVACAPLLDHLDEGIVVLDREVVHLANRAATRVLGLDAGGLTRTGDLLAVGLVDRDGTPVLADQHHALRALRTGRPVPAEPYGRIRPGTGRHWFLSRALPLLAPGAETPWAVVLVLVDLNEGTQTLDALRESELRFRTLAESLPVGIFHADVDGTFDYANPRWFEITDTDPDRVEDPSAQGMVLPEDRRSVGRELQAAFGERRPYEVRYRVRAGDGSTRWLSGRGSHTYDAVTGDATGIVGSIEDITPLVEAQENTVRLAGIVESTSDLVVIVEPTGAVAYANLAARQLLGLHEPLDATRYELLFPPDGVHLIEESVIPALRHQGSWSGELPMTAADGSLIVVWQKIVLERDANGRPVQVASTGRDVTQRHRFEQELAFRATHDLPTGLPNRALLLDRLELALARSRRDGRELALLFLDLDHFKQVNDQFGHEGGDELLAEVARRLEAVLRPSDTVARVGGDEFVVLTEEVDDEEHATAIAERIMTAVTGAPYRLGTGSFTMSVSIGIAVGDGQGSESEQLLRDADAAMYRAKSLGRARVDVFDEPMRRRIEARNTLADELAHGVEQGEIVVHYQPCIDLDTGRVTSVEALARWHHPARGMLQPGDFIGIAEETGLIVGLGLHVLSEACEEAHRWELDLGAGSPRINVNLSARQLTATDLPGLVEALLERTGLSPGKLCLEITESVLMEDAASVIDTLWALKGIGVSLAIDDFGTGYSSLSYLRRFPVDVLKVDRSFVDGLGPDPEDSAIVAAIVSLASTLELDAVAEGVETREQVDRLRVLGCTTAQGFLFAEPAPADAIGSIVATTYPV